MGSTVKPVFIHIQELKEFKIKFDQILTCGIEE